MRRSPEGLMKVLKKALVTAMTFCLLSAGALALELEPQRGGDEQKRPPKQEKDVPKTEKKDPPPSGNNSGGNRGGNTNKREKP